MKLYKTRTVRFPENEVNRIDKFLAQNSFLDFSTLTRLAISTFIEKPSVVIKPVSEVELKPKDHPIKRSRTNG